MKEMAMVNQPKYTSDLLNNCTHIFNLTHVTIIPHFLNSIISIFHIDINNNTTFCSVLIKLYFFSIKYVVIFCVEPSKE